MQYKLRNLIESKKTGQVVKGFTCPDDVAMFFSGCYFIVEKSGTCIVYSSGTSIIPTQDQIENYEFQATKQVQES